MGHAGQNCLCQGLAIDAGTAIVFEEVATLWTENVLIEVRETLALSCSVVAGVPCLLVRVLRRSLGCGIDRLGVSRSIRGRHICSGYRRELTVLARQCMLRGWGSSRTGGPLSPGGLGAGVVRLCVVYQSAHFRRLA
jgi:hypothetical protein